MEEKEGPKKDFDAASSEEISKLVMKERLESELLKIGRTITALQIHANNHGNKPEDVNRRSSLLVGVVDLEPLRICSGNVDVVSFEIDDEDIITALLSKQKFRAKAIRHKIDELDDLTSGYSK